MMASFSSMSQNRTAIIADPKLGKIELTDFSGVLLNADNLKADQLLRLKLPVLCDNHGLALPAGSCKLKIGLGSKLVLDPGFDLMDAGMSNYFKWTTATVGGQVQVTGELINNLPASVNMGNLALRLKVREEGNSTITANFLISNHNTATILSDENGANNASSLSYKIGKNGIADPTVAEGKLKLAVFPNPATNVKAVNISVLQGTMLGKYKISLYDMAGKLIHTKEMHLNFTTNFSYEFGNLSSGKYLIKVLNEKGTESSILKFEKL